MFGKRPNHTKEDLSNREVMRLDNLPTSKEDKHTYAKHVYNNTRGNASQKAGPKATMLDPLHQLVTVYGDLLRDRSLNA